jgi:TolA-binding protein
MGQSERSLRRLGRRVAEQQDQAEEAHLDRARGRARLLEAQIRPAGASAIRGPFMIRVVAPLAAALVLAALSVVIFVRPHDPLRFDLGVTEPGVVGAWISAPPEAELPIRFSDGSVLRLARGGRARVAAVDESGADVALERGSLDLSVVHRSRTRWTVRVGPFQIHVIGTRFDTHWDPVTERFGVALREGAITVSGPVVGEARAVHAGERIEVSASTATLEVGTIDGTLAHEGGSPSLPSAPTSESPTRAEPPAGAAPGALGSASVLARPDPGAASVHAEPVPSAEAPATTSWRALALDARYKDALAAAEQEGFDTICGSASAGDLRALGDAARLAGSSGRAVQAFTTLRSRFPGGAEAASAAFILGRMAQDNRRDYGGAAGWFNRYLSEQPGGAFAADALGRLVEVEDKRGDTAGARRAAERYLAAYPGGPHAAYAKRVLSLVDASAP